MLTDRQTVESTGLSLTPARPALPRCPAGPADGCPVAPPPSAGREWDARLPGHFPAAERTNTTGRRAECDTHSRSSGNCPREGDTHRGAPVRGSGGLGTRGASCGRQPQSRRPGRWGRGSAEGRPASTAPGFAAAEPASAPGAFPAAVLLAQPAAAFPLLSAGPWNHAPVRS